MFLVNSPTSENSIPSKQKTITSYYKLDSFLVLGIQINQCINIEAIIKGCLLLVKDFEDK